MSDNHENENKEKKLFQSLPKGVDKFKNLNDEEIRKKRLPGSDSLKSSHSIRQKPSLSNDEPNSSKNTPYAQDSNSNKTTLYNIHAPLLKACLISAKTISYADEEILSRDLIVGDDIKTTKINPDKSTTYHNMKFKSTKEKIDFVSKHFCKDKLIKAGLSAGASIWSQNVGASLGGHSDSNQLDTESNDDYSLKEASLDYTFLEIIRCKIEMPPKDDSVKLNKTALRELENINSLESAYNFLSKYGSHFLKADYDLGAKFLRFLNKSKNQTLQNRSKNNSHGTGSGFSKDVDISNFLNMNASGNSNQITNDVTGTENSESEQNTGNLFKITGYSAIKDEETFQQKTHESYEHLHVVNHNEIAQKMERFLFSLNKNELKDDELKENFDATFQPIWKLLGQVNSQAIELIKVMCSYIEDSLYFNAKFKSLSKQDCNESLIDNYLNYINKYLFDIVIEKNESNKFELGNKRFIILHQDVEFLKKLYRNQIDYIPEGDYLNYSRKNSSFYLLCYNEDLKRTNNILWENFLTDLCYKSREFKCAILNYKLHNDLNGTIINESIFGHKLDLFKIENSKVISDFELTEVASNNTHLSDHQVIDSKYVLTESNIQLKRFYNDHNDKLIISKDLYLIDSISPNAFENLKRLVEINLSNNQIRNLKKSQFGCLENVKEINISFNLIERVSVDTFTSDLKKLEKLLLNNNRINNIGIANVTSLKEINLENNQLKSISDKTFDASLINLKVLNLNNNMIDSIQPNSFKMLKNLREIFLEDNFLKKFEYESIGLSLVNLKNNPIVIDCPLIYINEYLSIHNNKIFKSMLDRTNMKKLIQICEFPEYQKWNLIYRATQDWFKFDNFLANCKNKPNTLVIVKSENGNVFGGYTEKSWSSYENDSNAFIFSLINKLNKPIKMKCICPDKSIYCFSDCIRFGRGDLCIGVRRDFNLFKHLDYAKGSNKTTNNYSNNYSNLGNSYKHPDYAYGSNEAKSFLAGSYEFQVSEIEVYTKQ